jgi:hypothetical protein
MGDDMKMIGERLAASIARTHAGMARAQASLEAWAMRHIWPKLVRARRRLGHLDYARSPDGIATRYAAASSYVDHVLDEWGRLHEMEYASLVTLRERLADREAEVREATGQWHGGPVGMAFYARIEVVEALMRHVEEIGPKVPEVPPGAVVDALDRRMTNDAWVAEAIGAAPGIAEHLPKTADVAARVLNVMCEMMEAFGDDPDAWDNVPAKAPDGRLSKQQLADDLGVSPETVKRYITDARNVAAQVSAKLRKRLRKTRPEPPM